MKAFGIACAAACAAVAIALPNWQNQLHAEGYSYALPKYFIDNAQLVDNLKFAGCKPVKLNETVNVVMYDDGYAVLNRNFGQVTGEWDKVNGQIYFNFDSTGRAALLGSKVTGSETTGFYSVKDLESCKLKNANTTVAEIIPASVGVSKNLAKVNAKTQLATYTIQMKGFHQTDAKVNKKTGENYVGAFSAKTVIKGFVQECSGPDYCGLVDEE